MRKTGIFFRASKYHLLSPSPWKLESSTGFMCLIGLEGIFFLLFLKTLMLSSPMLCLLLSYWRDIKVPKINVFKASFFICALQFFIKPLLKFLPKSKTLKAVNFLKCSRCTLYIPQLSPIVMERIERCNIINFGSQRRILCLHRYHQNYRPSLFDCNMTYVDL